MTRVHFNHHEGSFTTYTPLCGVATDAVQSTNIRKVTCKKCKKLQKERRKEHLKWAKERYREQYGY